VFFKNFVLRRVEQLRQDKKKPKLKDVILAIIKEKDKKNGKLREKLKKSVLDQHERAVQLKKYGTDPWLSRTIVYIDNLLKQIGNQTLSIDALERKIRMITKEINLEEQLEQRKVYKASEGIQMKKSSKPLTFSNAPQLSDNLELSSSEEEGYIQT